MRAVLLAVALLLYFYTQPAFAQPGVPAIPQSPEKQSPVAPNLPASETPSLPGGTEVSKPLQPGGSLPEPAEPKPVVEVPEFAEHTKCKSCEVLGRWWDSDEVLVWWPKAASLPPLVTATRTGAPPIFGRTDTVTLIGGRPIDSQDSAGWRTVLGVALNEADTVGIEGRYFFLGTRTLSAFAADLGNPANRAIGLPFVNAVTGQEDVLTIARPGASSDLVTVSTSSRLQGAEANAVANLVHAKHVKLHAIAGYRFFELHEGLRVEQTWLQYATPETLGHTTLGAIADQFSTANRFSGGQIGLHVDASRGPFYVEMVGKLALGRNFEVVNIEGETHLLTFGSNPLPLVRSYPGGVYSQITNMGKITNSAFALLPEGTFKLGLKTDRSRFFVGYNFLYLSDVVRPGDQVDRRINVTQIPMQNPGGQIVGPEFPKANLLRSDFWVQGLIVGFEARY